MILLKISNFFSGNGLNLVLGKILFPEQLGVYERISKIRNMPNKFLGFVLDNSLFPVMSEVQNSEKKLFNLYQRFLGMINSVYLPVATFLIFFSEEIVLILLGDKWIESILPLQIMFLVIPLSSSSRLADIVIRSKGLVYRNVRRKYIFIIFLLFNHFNILLFNY